MDAEASGLVTDGIYSRLRDMIMGNELVAGQKLVDRDLAETLGVSRTPIREVLARLAMTGLIEQRARRGYYVARFSIEQINDLYDFRKILEFHSAGLAAAHATPEHHLKMQELLNQCEEIAAAPDGQAALLKLDMDFHRLIATASNSKSLQDAVHDVIDKITCLVSVETAGASPGVLRNALDDHAALYRMIKAGDGPGCSSLMQQHIENAREALVRIFKARGDFQRAIRADTPVWRSENPASPAASPVQPAKKKQ